VISFSAGSACAEPHPTRRVRLSRQDEAPYRSSFRRGVTGTGTGVAVLTAVTTVAVDSDEVTGAERPGAGRGGRNKVLLTQNSSEVPYFLGYVTRFRSARSPGWL
jgi:hypothetical protein